MKMCCVHSLMMQRCLPDVSFTTSQSKNVWTAKKCITHLAFSKERSVDYFENPLRQQTKKGEEMMPCQSYVIQHVYMPVYGCLWWIKQEIHVFRHTVMKICSGVQRYLHKRMATCEQLACCPSVFTFYCLAVCSMQVQYFIVYSLFNGAA